MSKESPGAYAGFVVVMLLAAPVIGWTAYFLVFRFLFGMIRIVPVVGPAVYSGVDVVLHGSAVAANNRAQDAAGAVAADASADLMSPAFRGGTLHIESDALASEILADKARPHWRNAAPKNGRLCLGDTPVESVSVSRTDLRFDKHKGYLFVRWGGTDGIVAWLEGERLVRADGQQVARLDERGVLRAYDGTEVGAFVLPGQTVTGRLREIQRRERTLDAARDKQMEPVDVRGAGVADVMGGAVDARVAAEIARAERENEKRRS